MYPTPLPQSPRSSILSWPFPPPLSHLTLIGRSRAAWHTSFIIPQLDLLLDAGLCVSDRLRPKHVFITHGHADHALLAFAFVSRKDPPDVVVPEGMRGVFDAQILATTMMNLGGDLSENVFEEVDHSTGPSIGSGTITGAGTDTGTGAGTDTGTGAGTDTGTGIDTGTDTTTDSPLPTHTTHGVRHGDTVPLRRLRDTITAEAFDCDHTVPCVGYVFRKSTQRLHPSYHGLAGPELARLRKSSSEISPPLYYTHTTPLFAFLGDTTVRTLAAAPEWLQDTPVVITECTFLYPEHRAQAERTRHTLWADLEVVVRRWPQTTFVLTHFSLRYRDADVVKFFEDMGEDVPRNIVVWVDGGEGVGGNGRYAVPMDK